jgi:hypothetical protein
VIDSTSTYFDNILVSSRTNYISLDGKLSRSPEDRLSLSFEGLNMSYLNNLISGSPEKEEEPPLMNFDGLMKGKHNALGRL